MRTSCCIGVFDLTTSGKVSIIHLTREPLASADLAVGKEVL